MKLNKAKRRSINYWILCIVVGILLFIGNILVLVFVKVESSTAWLTLISGWISGIATLIVGIIAYKQSATFTKLSKKDNLTNRITNYISEFQTGYVTYIRDNNVSNIYTDFLILVVSNKLDSDIDQKKSSIIIAAEHIQKAFMYFEAILLKGFYSSEKTIELHNELKKVSNFNNDIVQRIIDKEYDKITIAKNANEYRASIDQLVAVQNKALSIILDYQSLLSKVLNENDLDLIYQEVENNKKQISEYFRSNFSDDIDQPINKEN